MAIDREQWEDSSGDADCEKNFGGRVLRTLCCCGNFDAHSASRRQLESGSTGVALISRSTA